MIKDVIHFQLSLNLVRQADSQNDSTANVYFGAPIHDVFHDAMDASTRPDSLHGWVSISRLGIGYAPISSTTNELATPYRPWR